MADIPDSAAGRSGSSNAAPGVPESWRGRLAFVGPGLILAAGGVGAGDLISALSGSAVFGMALVWAAVLGVVLKYTAVEALGRLYMSTGNTIMKSVQKVGGWLSVVFMFFFLVMGLLYGAALASLVGLALRALFPVLSVDGWAVIAILVAASIISIGRYLVFEKVMTALVVLMFVCIVGTACFTLINLKYPAEFASSMVPNLPDGSTFYTLAILGGVGGTFSTATYGYYVRDKGWQSAAWIPVMRIDVAVGYVLTFVFAFSLFVVGTGFLFGSGATIGGSKGLLALANPIADTLGTFVQWLFLGGFLFVVFSSTVSGLTSLSYLLADSTRVLRGISDERAAEYTSQNSRWFRGFLAYCVIPAIVIIFLGEPVFLALLYAAIGALILPLLAIVLLRLLNGRDVERRYRNSILSNTFLVAALLLFIGLAVQEFIGII